MAPSSSTTTITRAAIPFRSRTVMKETFHTVSLAQPHVTRGASVLDVGCGEGYVIEELARRGLDAHGVDIVDIRVPRSCPFSLYDGQSLAFPDASFDLVMLSFVLHHVPDDRKLRLLREAIRVSRDKVLVVEDTPASAVDRLASRRHGETYRRKIGSTAGFGFLTREEWRWLFRGMGFEPELMPLSRFCRSILQPFARTAFLLQRPAP
jgi:ubiquinone/menaquinone biosynthesis C-methylase UbiE